MYVTRFRSVLESSTPRDLVNTKRVDSRFKGLILIFTPTSGEGKADTVTVFSSVLLRIGILDLLINLRFGLLSDVADSEYLLVSSFSELTIEDGWSFIVGKDRKRP